MLRSSTTGPDLLGTVSADLAGRPARGLRCEFLPGREVRGKVVRPADVATANEDLRCRATPGNRTDGDVDT